MTAHRDAAGLAVALAEVVGGEVTVVCHVNPDADAIGSAAALASVLRRLGARVYPTFDPGVVPAPLDAIPGAEHVRPLAEVPAHDGAVVVLDCASPARMGRAQELTGSASRVLVVDHHRSNPGFGTDLLLDVTAPSTASLVAEVLDAAGWDLRSGEATALLAGLTTDTGSFRWGGPTAHPTAARLEAAGADAALVTEELLEPRDFGWLRVKSEVLATAELDPGAAGGRGAVWLTVPRPVMRQISANDAESLVEEIRGVRQAAVAVLLKEYDTDRWAVSLRSRDGLDVSAVAAALGGGGHRAAAGCSVRGPVAEVRARVRDALG